MTEPATPARDESVGPFPGNGPSPGWGLLGLLMLLSATQQFHRLGLAAVPGQVMRDCSLTEEELGLLQSIFLIAYTVAMIPGGWLADRIGTHRTLLLVACGTGFFGIMTGAAGWLAATPYAVWLWIAFARGAMGLTCAPLYPSTSRTVASWFPVSRQVLANSLVTGAALLGIALSQEVMSTLDTAVGWPAAFVLTGTAALAVAALWAVAGRGSPPAPRGEFPPGPAGAVGGRLARHSGWQRVLFHPGILALTLSYGAVGYFEYTLFYWTKYYFKEVLHLDEVQSTHYAAVPNLVMMLMIPAGGLACWWLSSRWTPRRALPAVAIGSMVLAALFLYLGAVTRDPADVTSTVVFFSLALGFIGASEGPFWTAAVRLGGPRGATAGGIVNTGGNLVGQLGPTLTPLIAGFVNKGWWGASTPAETGPGWTAALLFASALSLAGTLPWWWVDVEKPLEPEGGG